MAKTTWHPTRMHHGNAKGRHVKTPPTPELQRWRTCFHGITRHSPVPRSVIPGQNLFFAPE
eukprot:scaffold619_cov368-Pavlova_lutheri.AAC.1